MSHVHACANSSAQLPPHHLQTPELSNSDSIALETTRLHQRAINGLTDALNVLRSSPMVTADLQHALGRGMRGVTALKRLNTLRCAASDSPSCSAATTQGVPKVDASCLNTAASEASYSLFPSTFPAKQRRRRRYFDRSYKQQVAQLIRQQHLSVSWASKEFNINASMVRRWLIEFDAEQAANSSAVQQPNLSEVERISALEERLRQLQADNELLKKATALFAREIYCSSAVQGQ